jgi:thioredoxin reductase
MAADGPAPEHEVAIVGGGPAGLSAALVLGRSLVDAVVISADRPRNSASSHSHGFLSRDGIPPLELTAAARADLDRYATIALVEDTVGTVVASGGGFALATASGRELSARRVLFATGRPDRLERLGLPGLEEVYGVTVFPCPFCDGWERRGEPLAVFGGAEAVKVARFASRWTDDLVVFAGGEGLIGDPERQSLERNGVRVETRPVAALEHEAGRLRAVVLGDGERVPRSGGFVATEAIEPPAELAAQLGAATAGGGAPEAGADGRTSLAGVYAAGDLVSGFAGVADAAAAGYRVAKAIVQDLIEEQWR